MFDELYKFYKIHDEIIKLYFSTLGFFKPHKHFLAISILFSITSLTPTLFLTLPEVLKVRYKKFYVISNHSKYFCNFDSVIKYFYFVRRLFKN